MRIGELTREDHETLQSRIVDNDDKHAQVSRNFLIETRRL